MSPVGEEVAMEKVPIHKCKEVYAKSQGLSIERPPRRVAPNLRNLGLKTPIIGDLGTKPFIAK